MWKNNSKQVIHTPTPVSGNRKCGWILAEFGSGKTSVTLTKIPAAIKQEDELDYVITKQINKPAQQNPTNEVKRQVVS